MQETTVWTIVTAVAGLVVLTLIFTVNYANYATQKIAFENGYEQQQVPGGSRVIWVKAPVSATCAR